MLSPNMLVFTVLLGICWLYLFLRRKETRFEMIAIGVMTTLLTPLSLGTRGAFDFAFSFFFAGIAAVAFQQIFGKSYGVRRKRTAPRKAASGWFLRLFLLTIAWTWSALLLTYLLEVSTWQAIVVSALFVTSYVIAHRRDLLNDALASGLLMAVIIFVLYEIAFYQDTGDVMNGIWNDLSLSDRFLLSTPLPIIIWSAAMGFALGPLYEFVRGWKLTSPTA